MAKKLGNKWDGNEISYFIIGEMKSQGWLKKIAFLPADEIRVCFCSEIDLWNDKFPNGSLGNGSLL